MTQQAPTHTDMTCSQCGRTLAQSNLVQIAGNWVCGDCKPAFLSRVWFCQTYCERRVAGRLCSTEAFWRLRSFSACFTKS